jgi:hypothetical protein
MKMHKERRRRKRPFGLFAFGRLCLLHIIKQRGKVAKGIFKKASRIPLAIFSLKPPKKDTSRSPPPPLHIILILHCPIWSIPFCRLLLLMPFLHSTQILIPSSIL